MGTCGWNKIIVILLSLIFKNKDDGFARIMLMVISFTYAHPSILVLILILKLFFSFLRKKKLFAIFY